MSVPPPDAWPTPQAAGPAPLDQPQYDATIGQAATRFWRKFATFSGRASRSEYWWWTLISALVSVVLQIAGRVLIGPGFLTPTDSTFDLRSILLPLVPSLAWSLIILIPQIALSVRRLHDTNRSGWWYLLSVPALIGLPFQLVGLASFNPEQLVAGDFSGLAVGPLVVGGIMGLLGGIDGIVLLIFFIFGPDSRGARFDQRVSQDQD